MDPKVLRLIVSTLGMVMMTAWLLQVATSWLTRRASVPTALRKLAGSRFWPGAANASSVSLLTGLMIEFALTGRLDELFVIGIIALSCLVCEMMDRLRGPAEK